MLSVPAFFMSYKMSPLKETVRFQSNLDKFKAWGRKGSLKPRNTAPGEVDFEREAAENRGANNNNKRKSHLFSASSNTSSRIK